MRLPILIAAILVFAQNVLAKTIVIDTPDLCAYVERVEGNRVDLRKESEPCAIEGPGKASIQIDEETKEIDVYVNRTYWRKYPRGRHRCPSAMLPIPSRGQRAMAKNCLFPKVSTKLRGCG
jgi:hypothetical protein